MYKHQRIPFLQREWAFGGYAFFDPKLNANMRDPCYCCRRWNCHPSELKVVTRLSRLWWPERSTMQFGTTQDRSVKHYSIVLCSHLKSVQMDRWLKMMLLDKVLLRLIKYILVLGTMPTGAGLCPFVFCRTPGLLCCIVPCALVPCCSFLACTSMCLCVGECLLWVTGNLMTN